MMKLTSHFRKIFFLALTLICTVFIGFSQDDLEDFDPSMFEEAGEATKAFCTNKVLGQSPTPLISFAFDYQGPSTLGSGEFSSYEQQDVELGFSGGFRFVSNVPVLSRNNILINWGVSYVQLGYNLTNDNLSSPLSENLRNHSLKWLNTNFTVFKPISDRYFVLLQLAGEINGDYQFANFPSLSQIRLPAAAIYGFKPSDNLMWGVGISNTYLGGARNLLPVIYYYHTFKNPKWGIEALFPARIQARYRWDSRSLLLFGYQVEGATYRLGNFNEYDFATNDSQENRFEEVELRRSEIRLGFSYKRGLNDFVWLSADAGYRINYLFNVDEGEFYRGFNDEDFLMENTLSGTVYLQVGISLVSP
ncbi:MAG: hypothetical protein AAF789_10245 [Bacteroidota bacterium]